MADDRRWADPQDTTCIPDTRTIHSHAHYALVGAWFVSVVEKLKLEAVFAISTQVTLYT